MTDEELFVRYAAAALDALLHQGSTESHCVVTSMAIAEAMLGEHRARFPKPESVAYEVSP